MLVCDVDLQPVRWVLQIDERLGDQIEPVIAGAGPRAAGRSGYTLPVTLSPDHPTVIESVSSASVADRGRVERPLSTVLTLPLTDPNLDRRMRLSCAAWREKTSRSNPTHHELLVGHKQERRFEAHVYAESHRSYRDRPCPSSGANKAV